MAPTQYSPQEAAAVARLPLSAIQKAITGRAIPARRDARSGARRIDETALLALALTRAMPTELKVLPRDAYAILREAKGGADLVVGGVVRIDAATMLAETRQRLHLLARARDLVVSDPAILGGTPVLKGTRITPHALLDRVRDGDTVEDILADYPQLDHEVVEAALIHAEAHPLRGRPRGKPWHPGS